MRDRVKHCCVGRVVNTALLGVSFAALAASAYAAEYKMTVNKDRLVNSEPLRLRAAPCSGSHWQRLPCRRRPPSTR